MPFPGAVPLRLRCRAGRGSCLRRQRRRDTRCRFGAGWRRCPCRPDPALEQRIGRRPDQPAQAAQTAKLQPGQLRPAASPRSGRRLSLRRNRQAQGKASAAVPRSTDSCRHRWSHPLAALTNPLTRSGSTGFHQTPSCLREDATMTPSAIARMAPTLSAFTPLPTSVGRSDAALICWM